MKQMDWDFSAPQSTVIGDHDVPILSSHLQGKRIALLVCGGIASMKTPLLARSLRRRGAEVTAFCTEEALLHYVGRQALEWACCRPLVTELTWRAEHLSDGIGFDAYLVAPATYNTIGKLHAGIADTVVTSALASAMGRLAQGATQILIAPTMHGTMHHEILARNCRELAALGVRFVTPRDDHGKHNLPDDEVLVMAVCRALSKSPLREKKILLDLGFPNVLDKTHAVANTHTAALFSAITEELLLRGANATLCYGDILWKAPRWMPVVPSSTYDAYRDNLTCLLQEALDVAIVDTSLKLLLKSRAFQQEAIDDFAHNLNALDLVRGQERAPIVVSTQNVATSYYDVLKLLAQNQPERCAIRVAGGELTGQPEPVYCLLQQGHESRIVGVSTFLRVLVDTLEGMLVTP